MTQKIPVVSTNSIKLRYDVSEYTRLVHVQVLGYQRKANTHQHTHFSSYDSSSYDHDASYATRQISKINERSSPIKRRENVDKLNFQ